MLNIATTYEQRVMSLRALRFYSYLDYLKSTLWARIRKITYAIKGRECFLCGDPACVLHHNSYDYDTLSGRSIQRITPLCENYHERIEFDSTGKKVDVRDACERFLLLRCARLGCDMSKRNMSLIYGDDCSAEENADILERSLKAS